MRGSVLLSDLLLHYVSPAECQVLLRDEEHDGRQIALDCKQHHDVRGNAEPVAIVHELACDAAVQDLGVALAGVYIGQDNLLYSAWHSHELS